MLKVLLPTQIMSEKDRKKYERSGYVKSYNVYERILPIEEFLKHRVEQQKLMLEAWRERFTNEDILSKMNVNITQYYELVRSLGCKRTYKKNKHKKKNTNNIQLSPPILDEGDDLDYELEKGLNDMLNLESPELSLDFEVPNTSLNVEEDRSKREDEASSKADDQDKKYKSITMIFEGDMTDTELENELIEHAVEELRSAFINAFKEKKDGKIGFEIAPTQYKLKKITVLNKL